MGCCGNGRRATAQATRYGNGIRGVTMTMEPVEGMELLRYEGGNYGKHPYVGVVTKRTYYFGASEANRQKYVDTRDVHDSKGFLSLVEGRKPLFSVVQTKAKAKTQASPVMAVVPGNLTVASSEATGKLSFEQPTNVELVGGVAVELTSGPDSVAIAVDPGEMTLVELSDYVAGLSKEQLATLLDAEKAGKARKGAINLLEEALYEESDAS